MSDAAAPPELRSRPEISVRPWLWAFVGVLGLLLVAGAATLDMEGLLERGASWWRPLLTLPGHLLVIVAWWQLGPAIKRPLAVLSVWVLALLFVPPLHSRDAFSYAAQGYLMTHGLDPYVVASGAAGEPGLLVGVHWFKTTSVYPPLSLELFGAVSRLFDAHLYWTVVGMRLPNLLAMAVLAWCLPKLAARVGVSRSAVLWAGLLNPLVLMQWVGGIHNDAVMVALLAVACLAAQSIRWRGYAGMLAGGALVGVAMAVKQSAAVAGLGVVALAWAAAAPHLEERRRTWGGLVRRTLAAGGMALAVFVLISLATGLGFGWNARTAGSPLAATSNAPISWVASFLRFHELLSPTGVIAVLTPLTSLLVVGAAVWLVLRFGPRPPATTGQPWALAAGVLTAFAILGPALQPWYLTWAVPFVILARPSRRWQQVWLLVVVLASVIPALQDLMAPYLAMGLLVVPGWLLWRRMRRLGTTVFPDAGTVV